MKELFHFIEEIDFIPCRPRDQQHHWNARGLQLSAHILHKNNSNIKHQTNRQHWASATHNNHTENQRSWQKKLQMRIIFIRDSRQKNRARRGFLAVSAAKFWTRDFNSASESVFLGILGDFLSPCILTKARCFRVHQLHLLRHVGTYIQIHIKIHLFRVCLQKTR